MKKFFLATMLIITAALAAVCFANRQGFLPVKSEASIPGDSASLQVDYSFIQVTSCAVFSKY